MSFTVLGAKGFIGAALVEWLQSQDHVVHAVTRASLPELLATRGPAGHVIDCVGLTADFRTRPLETADAHVGLVARCLSLLSFDSFLLLSSTRVYARASATHEHAELPVQPGDPSDLYNLTKLAGEALCFADPRQEIRVARLSNVYGNGMPADSFLGQVLQEGRQTGSVVFRQGPQSAKDYISIAAVVRLLPLIATNGSERSYNVAAGRNTSHATLAERLHAVAGWRTQFTDGAATTAFLPIDVTRVEAEFGSVGSDVSADLPGLLEFAQEHQCSPSTSRLAA